MAGLPLHDAILIENGVVSRVNRIAYAISHTQNLADMFRASGITRQLVAEAEAAAEGIRVATFGGQARAGVGQRFPGRVKGESPFAAGQAGTKLAGRAKLDPIVKVSKTAKRLIAAELGVLVAYDRGVKRKAAQATQFMGTSTGMYDKERVTKTGRKGTVVGRKGAKSEGRTARLARIEEKLTGPRRTKVEGNWAAAEAGLKAAGFDWVDLNLPAKYGGYHAQAEKRDTDAWAFAKAKLRQKYRDQAGPGWYDVPEVRKAYDAELALLTGARRAAGTDKGYRAGATAYSRQRATSPKQARPRGVKTNPFSDVGDLALTNPGTGVGFLDSIEDSVSGLPVVGGYVAPLIAPALLGAAAAGIHAVAVPKLKSMLPENVQPYTYSIAGAAVAVVASVIAGKASDETTKNLAGLIGGAALAFGVGFDVNSALESKFAGNKGGDDDFGGLALAGDDYGAVALGEAPSALGGFGEAPSALGAVALGDGMAYQTAPLGFDGATSAIHSAYGDASLADAYFSGPDFDASEGEAIMAGASAFGAAAGRPPRLATGQRKAQSHYAGRQYHRWGWLIKQISFPALQQVAALPPDERLKVINQLRSQALALVARASEQAKAEQLASAPIPAAPELAAQGAMAGYDMNGYGALVLAGGGY